MTPAGFDAAWRALPPAPRRSLELAYMSLAAGGLAVGAVLTDVEGSIVAEGRNRAYDPPGGDDALQGTPLAHAEMNVLAKVPTGADLSGCVLWSTQEPCAMCSAAVAFTGVGEVRHIAPDPSATGVDLEAKAVQSIGPAEDEWLVTANVLFLFCVVSKRGVGAPMILTSLELEPETAGIVVDLVEHGQTAEAWARGRTIAEALASCWEPIVSAADARRERLG